MQRVVDVRAPLRVDVEDAVAAQVHAPGCREGNPIITLPTVSLPQLPGSCYYTPLEVTTLYFFFRFL